MAVCDLGHILFMLTQKSQCSVMKAGLKSWKSHSHPLAKICINPAFTDPSAVEIGLVL